MDIAYLFSALARCMYSARRCHRKLSDLDLGQLPSSCGPPRHHRTELEGRDHPVSGEHPVPIQNQPAIQSIRHSLLSLSATADSSLPPSVSKSSLPFAAHSSPPSMGKSSPPSAAKSSLPFAAHSSPPSMGKSSRHQQGSQALHLRGNQGRISREVKPKGLSTVKPAGSSPRAHGYVATPGVLGSCPLTRVCSRILSFVSWVSIASAGPVQLPSSPESPSPPLVPFSSPLSPEPPSSPVVVALLLAGASSACSSRAPSRSAPPEPPGLLSCQLRHGLMNSLICHGFPNYLLRLGSLIRPGGFLCVPVLHQPPGLHMQHVCSKVLGFLLIETS